MHPQQHHSHLQTSPSSVYSLFTLCHLFCHTISFLWKVLSHNSLLSHQAAASVLTNVTTSAGITRKGPKQLAGWLHCPHEADCSPVSEVFSTLRLSVVALSIVSACRSPLLCANKPGELEGAPGPDFHIYYAQHFLLKALGCIWKFSLWVWNRSWPMCPSGDFLMSVDTIFLLQIRWFCTW